MAPAIAPRRGLPAAPTGAATTANRRPRAGGPPAATADSAPTASGPPTSARPTGPTATPSTAWPTGTGSPPATATATASAPAVLSPGTLAVSPKTVPLLPVLGGSLTLTANGGPVGWMITEPASLIGKLTVWPASGTLNAGDSVTVAITAVGLATLDARLIVDPGGQQVTVLLGLG